jgi:hypothetical protein
VCHLIDAAASSAHHTQHSCTVYANPSAKSRIESHKNHNFSSKFEGVWVMSDDEDASKTNLVNSQTPKWQAINVTFTSEGAKFNGNSSKMTLENATFSDISNGFTWLLRVAREPNKRQSFLAECNWIKGQHLCRIFISSGNRLSFSSEFHFHERKHLRASTPVTEDSNQFINIGVTALPASNKYSLFYEGGFVELSEDRKTSASAVFPELSCFTLGGSCTGSRPLHGTVRAVAIANSLMTETEINQFFDQIG